MENKFSIKSKAFRYAVVRRPSGFSEKSRRWGEMKFVYVEDGRAVWNINGADIIVEKGNILLFCEKDVRYIKNVISEQPLVIKDVRFSPLTVFPFQNCVSFFFDRSSKFANVLTKECPLYDYLVECFREIDDEVRSDRPWRAERISNVITSMAIYISRIFDTEENKKTSLANPQYDVVCRAIEYIDNNLKDDLSRDTLAKMLYVSPSHLSRIFKEYSGVCLQNYIVESRVKNAINLIQNGYRPLDAAFESGFSSSSGFYRAFQAVTGGNPKNFL